MADSLDDEPGRPPAREPRALDPLFAAISEGVVWIDAAGRVVDANRAARALFAASPELEGALLARVRSKVDEQAAAGRQPPAARSVHLVTAMVAGQEKHFDAQVEPIASRDGSDDGVLLVVRDVSRRERAEKQLQRALAFQSALLETTPAMIYTYDRQGVFQSANRATHQVLGLPEGSLPGRSLAEFMTPEAAAGFTQRTERLLAEGEIEGEVELRVGDGSPRAVQFRNRLAYVGEQSLLLGTAVEVTERRRLERTLRQAIDDLELRSAAVAASEERYRALFEQSLGLLCTHTLDGRILTINGAAAAGLGRPVDQVVGQNLADLLAPGLRGELAAYLAAIAEQGEASGTMILLDAGGNQRVWQYRNLLVRDPGQDAYVVGNALDVTDRTRLERELRELAATDHLTRLANRALFEDRLRRAIDRGKRDAERHGELSRMALVYLDLDGFKAVNDRFGHAAGDALLCEVAARLRRGVRTLDTVARLGGDEFALILPDIGSAANARNLVEKLLASLCLPFTHDESALPVSVSLGVSLFPDDGDTAAALTTRADGAMYAAKGAGGNALRFHGDDR